MSVEPSSLDKESREGRPRRLRWFVRLLIWGLAVLAGLTLAAGLLLESRWLRGVLQEKVVVAASETLGREVTIEAVDFDLLPPAAELIGLVIAGDGRSPEPLVRIERLRVRVGPGIVPAVLGWGPLVLAEIDLDRPQLVVVSHADGSSNLPELPGRDPAETGDLEVRIGTLRLTDGMARLDERSVPLDLSAARLQAVLRGSSDGTHSLTAGSERLRLEAPNGVLEGSLRLQAELSDKGVALTQARLRGAALDVEATGSYRAGTLALELSGSADLALLASLGGVEDVAGRVDVTGEIETSDGSWMVRADLAAHEMSFAGVEVGSAVFGISGSSDRLAIEIRQAGLVEGQVQGTVVLAPPARDGEIVVDLEVESLDLATIVALLDAPAPDLAGSVSGELTASLPLERPLDGHGRAEVRIAPPQGAGAPGAASRSPVRADISLAVDRGVVTLESARLDALGQRVLLSGSAAVGEQIDLSLAFEGIDLGGVLHLVDSPVTGLEGRMRGDLDYRFAPDAPTYGIGSAVVFVEAPEEIVETGGGPWSVPVDGQARVVADNGVLTVEESVLGSPRQRIALTGEVDLNAAVASLSFDLGTQDPRALLHLLPVIYEEDPEPLWEPTAGSGTLVGTLQADATGFRTQLELELESAVLTGSPVARVEGALLIDSGGIQELALDLSRSDGSVGVRGAVPFETETPGYPAPDLRLELEIDGWALGDAEPWLELELPVEGVATARVELGGSLEALEGSVEGQVHDLSVEGVELAGEVQGSMIFDPEGVVIEEARLILPAGELRMTGFYETLTEEIEFEVASTPLDLAADPFTGWLEGSLGGVVEAHARLGGSVTDPTLSARIVGTGLAIGAHLLGDDGSSEIELEWQEGQLEVAGSLIGLIEAEGGGRLTTESVDLDIRLASEALHEFVELAVGEVPEEFAGSFAGSLIVRRDETMSLVEIRLDPVELELLGSRLANLEPVVVSFDETGARIESLYLSEQGTGSELFVVGSLGSAEADMDLRVISSIDIAWLAFFLDGMEISGRGDLLAVVRGSIEAPQIDGQAELSNGRLIIEGFPHAVEQMHGFLFLYPQRVVIDSGRARFAGGELLAEGDIALGEEEGVSYELRFAGSDLDIRYPEDWRIRGDGQLVLSESPSGRHLNGTVALESAAFVKEFQLGFTQLVRTVFQRRPEVVEETDEVLVGTRLNIAVDGPDALHIQTDLAELRGDLDLTVRGSLAAPVLLGEITLARGGEIDLGGTEYQLERGTLTFANPFRNDPRLDLVASASIQAYEVQLNVYGPADDLQTSLSSNPPLSNLDIVSLLATGRVDLLGEIGSGVATGERTTSAEAFLAGQAASFAGKRVGSFIGLDRVQISPLTGGSADLSAARITVGRRISRDVFVTYSYDPSESEEGVFELRWQVYPSISLVLTRSDDGSLAADMRWDTTF